MERVSHKTMLANLTDASLTLKALGKAAELAAKAWLTGKGMSLPEKDKLEYQISQTHFAEAVDYSALDRWAEFEPLVEKNTHEAE